MRVFIKTMKIHYVLNGIHENPETRSMKKASQQQKTPVGTSGFRCRILIKSLANVHGAQARSTRRGPPWSTWLNYYYLLKNYTPPTVIRKNIGARDTGFFLYFCSFSCIFLLFFSVFSRFLSISISYHRFSYYREGG